MSSHYNTPKVENARLEMTENRVLVRPAPESQKTEGGILLPDSARGKPTEGFVLAVGPGRVSNEGKLIPMSYKEGQKVIYGTYSGTEIEVDGVECLILKEPDIYCIVHPLPAEAAVEPPQPVEVEA